MSLQLRIFAACGGLSTRSHFAACARAESHELFRRGVPACVSAPGSARSASGLTMLTLDALMVGLIMSLNDLSLRS
jgi:hypothetical protein